ncbi:MAG: DUF2845 domain-containing protein [Candidatus Omnitrophica bacterium]|nr:DUF2845 domain-containing protein [Candidatus Omnitrophota bacterium]
MKKLLLILLCLGLVGCATTSKITPNLSLGMTKQEVIAKCGQPLQKSAIKGSDGKTYDSFVYKETIYQNAAAIGAASEVITYVNFADGKVIYFGNPNPPETIQQTAGTGMSSRPVYQDNTQETFRQMQQQGNDAWDRATQATQNYYQNLPKPPKQTNCQTSCNNYGNCTTTCQ